MNLITLASLHHKFPDQIPVALDSRNRNLSVSTGGSDVRTPSLVVRTRKPRSRETIVLTEFDTDMHLSYLLENKRVYYSPDSDDQYGTFTTQVAHQMDQSEFVSEIVNDALHQSLVEQGAMCEWETRIFWIANQGVAGDLRRIYATVVREKRIYRVAAEIGRSKSCFYTSLFSIQLAA